MCQVIFILLYERISVFAGDNCAFQFTVAGERREAVAVDGHSTSCKKN